MVKAASSYRISGPGYVPSVTAQIDDSTIFQYFPANPLSFLSSRLSQFTKATRIFTTRGSRFRTWALAAEFHQACDNIPNTLVIIKSGQYIAGGYTEVAWSSPSEETHFRSEKAFLFSVNRKKIYNIVNADTAILCAKSRGPSFGRQGDGMNVDGEGFSEYCHGATSLLSSYNTTEIESRYSDTELWTMPDCSEVDEYEVYKLE